MSKIKKCEIEFIMTEPSTNGPNCKSGPNIEICYKNKEEVDNLSIVGMICCKDGILAFGDKKTTRVFKDGYMEEDLERGEVPKVFRNQNLVVATFGKNQIFSKNIEKSIQEILTKAQNYKEVIDMFEEELSSYYANDEYNLLIGTSNKTGYIITLAKFKNTRLVYCDYSTDFFTGGNNIYVDLLNDFFVWRFVNVWGRNSKYDITCEEMKSLLDDYLRKISSFLENTISYNPVSLDFDYIEFK